MAKDPDRIGKPPEPEFRDVIVKLVEGGVLEQHDERLVATHLTLEEFYEVVASVKGAKPRKSFPQNVERLREMRDLASAHLEQPLPSLDLFVRVRVPPDVDVDALARRFSGDSETEYACPAGIPAPPPSTTPDLTANQGYLRDDPGGVGAEYSWLCPGGDGTGVQVCDCENGYSGAHEDLPPIQDVTNHSGPIYTDVQHGVKTFGVLSALHDGKGVSGICHGASMLFSSCAGGYNTEAVGDAMLRLAPGDVMLVEMEEYAYQGGAFVRVPIEYDSDTRAGITQAVGNKLVVVVAAGNGNHDLAPLTDSLGHHVWDPTSSHYDNTKAIMVGAGQSSQPPQSKCPESNFGARVDCQGWGEMVATTSYGGDNSLNPGGAADAQYSWFAGTSSASAIVASVAACLQGAHKAAFGGPLSPEDVRDYLSDADNGTPQVGTTQFPVATCPIGPLPDLRKLLPAVGVRADVYGRDSLDDTGVEPYTGPELWRSPDLIPRRSEVILSDVDAELGAAHWGEADLADDIVLNQDNFVYVRLHNRGLAPDVVDVTVYWVEPSTFIHPSSWHEIGVLTGETVAVDERRVLGPLTWPESELPPAGHYCLVAAVNSTVDPLTLPDAFTSVFDYLSFVRDHNNLFYRNVTVVDPDATGATRLWSFFLRGFPNKAESFRLEIHHELPGCVELTATVGMAMLEARSQCGARSESNTTVLRAAGWRTLTLDDIPLWRDARVPVDVEVHTPKDAPPGEYLVSAEQYWGQTKLGRVNLVVRVPNVGRPNRGTQA